MDYAVTCKDEILKTLEDALRGNQADYLETCREILRSLELTAKLWKACDYSYKAGEICGIIRENVLRECYEGSDVQHLATYADRLQNMFNSLQWTTN